MGNLFKRKQNIVNKIDYGKLNDFDKNQLVSYINNMKIKKLTIDNNFTNCLNNIELINCKLIQMTIEFYEQIKDIVPEFIIMNNNNKLKKFYFVKPQFGPEKVIDNSNIEVNKTINLDLFRIDNIDKPFVMFNDNDISLIEYDTAFNCKIMLNNDMIGISKKMLEFLNNYLKLRFINCYNQLYAATIDISDISFGKASYIYKKGSKLDIKSFRQIITIPNVVNHFHRILALRINNYVIANKYINTNIQKGGSAGLKKPILQQIYKVKRVLKDANMRKKQVAVMFLDLSNAFGSLNLESLYMILKEYHFPDNYINYIRTYYNNFKYYVKTKEWTTNLINWKNGLIQGCPMSPILFVLAINYVLEYLDKTYKSTMGYEFNNNIKILFTVYMDDICIQCANKESLVIVYNELKRLFGMMGLKINSNKTAMMIINQDDVDNFNLDNIKKVKVYKYLGEYLCSDGTNSECYKKFIRVLQGKLFALDKKIIYNSKKIEIFRRYYYPWIVRKLAFMYDLNNKNRLKIIVTIKNYINKWGFSDDLQIFSSIVDLLNDTKDNVIENIGLDTDYDEELKNDVELANYIMNNNNINITYDTINENIELDKLI